MKNGKVFKELMTGCICVIDSFANNFLVYASFFVDHLHHCESCYLEALGPELIGSLIVRVRL